MTITLAEEIMLLSLDDESGAAKQREAAGWAVAGGILLELVMAGRVSVTGKDLELTDTTATGQPLLDTRLQLLETWMRGKSRRRVTDWLTKDHAKAVGATLESLRDRGVVLETRHKVLGVFPTRRHPEADGSVERELRDRLDAVVLAGAEPDERTAGLIALIHSAKLGRLVFPDAPRKETAARLAEVADGQWATEQVRKAIRDMQAAMAAVTVVTIATVT
ncbi:GOLPH3/VPS74 family protein [Streptomyces sp. H27-H5]|uniref:GOLPH3/VPS74 family protein n=1 Tax=Streptomyces sp. H27-H5 TaxID=2996460 RepID=UPI002270EB0B|nr:GPP34 family phosphoprotein [Streptomyces sp. H27-H5]MCY0957800.1 GPP34 family phosphoprotein [Streptomyces sp. H27-H5]